MFIFYFMYPSQISLQLPNQTKYLVGCIDTKTFIDKYLHNSENCILNYSVALEL